MSVEERFMEAIEDTEEETSMPTGYERLAGRHEKLQEKHKAVINDFLGEGNRMDAAIIKPRRYGELLTWALHRYMQLECWKIVRTLGHHNPQPAYVDVDTGEGECQNLLRDGVLFIKKGETPLTVTVELSLRTYNNSVVICGAASDKEKILQFAKGVEKIANEQNFYRGKKLEVAGRIRFLDLPTKSWDSVIMDAEIKGEIWANTIGFLASSERLARYGIPPKRGVLLVGEPGTGKTLVCKALMAEAQGVTCLLANAYGLGEEEYITELYQVAHDLAPSLVVVEDIDSIARDRMEYGYSRGPALLALLSTLDGIEEHREIVTVATTNYLEVIDKAIGHRPSRFDRVVRITLPNLEQRKQFIASVCQKIPLEEDTRDYVAHGTDKMTPAQIQEVIYSLVIGYAQNGCEDRSRLRFSAEVVDKAISRINGKRQHHLGFAPGDNHNGDRRWNHEVLSQR